MISGEVVVVVVAALRVRQQELAARAKPDEDVTGLDGRERHDVLEAERQPRRKSTEESLVPLSDSVSADGDFAACLA